MSITVREGPLTAQIWKSATRTKGRAYSRWEFLDPRNGDRLKRSSAETARAEWRSRAKLLLDGGVVLRGADAQNYRSAVAELVGTGLSLPAAAKLAADEVRAKLVCRTTKTLKELVAECLAARRADGAGAEHLNDLRKRLDRLIKEVHCPVSQLTAGVLDDFIRAVPGALRTRSNFRGAVANLVSFAKSRSYLSEAFGKLARVNAPGRLLQSEVTVFTPEEMLWLIAGAHRKKDVNGETVRVTTSILPLLLIGGFAGLRTSEVLALDWSAIDLEGGHIIVPAKTKTGRRLAPLPENLRAWLTHLKRPGPVLPMSKHGISKALVRTVAETNRLLEKDNIRWRVKWRHNALRHSFGSYRCALLRDVAQVSEEMGNSVGMVKKHYRKVVTPTAAKEWFSLSPEGQPGVIQGSLWDQPRRKSISPTSPQPLLALENPQ